MRQLKFRVWTGIEMMYDVTVGRFGNFYVNPGAKGDGLDPNDSASLTPFTTKYENAPVMQFTGLLDANGKEIYEGDVIQTNHISKGVVEFSRMASQWWLRFTDDVSHRKTYKELVPDTGAEHYSVTWAEVVGHIYEPSQKTEA